MWASSTHHQLLTVQKLHDLAFTQGSTLLSILTEGTGPGPSAKHLGGLGPSYV